MAESTGSSFPLETTNERTTLMLGFIIIMLLGFVLPIAVVMVSEWRRPTTRTSDQLVPVAPRTYYGMGRRR